MAVALAGTAAADETTFCNFFVTSLPFTASAQGHYCLTQNLSTAITTGNAITINSDFVVLDLNNFKLGGGSAGLATQTNGIFTNAHRNVTIRNGNIRGFKYGIRIDGSIGNSGGHLIENNLLDGNTFRGLQAIGDTMVVRNNTVSNTGGSTTDNNPYGIRIFGTSAQIVLVKENVVSNTFTMTGSSAVGIGYGNYLVSDHNLVRMGSVGSPYRVGIRAGLCRDDSVFGSDLAFQCSQAGNNFAP